MAVVVMVVCFSISFESNEDLIY